MKLRVLLLSLMAVFFVSAAQAMPDNPGVCPSPEAIQKGGIGYIDQYEGDWIALQVGYYDTPVQWVFGIGGIKAKSEKDALKHANSALTTVAGNPHPQADTKNGFWVCVYKIDKGYYSVALYPLPS